MVTHPAASSPLIASNAVKRRSMDCSTPRRNGAGSVLPPTTPESGSSAGMVGGDWAGLAVGEEGWTPVSTDDESDEPTWAMEGLRKKI